MNPQQLQAFVMVMIAAVSMIVFKFIVIMIQR